MHNLEPVRSLSSANQARHTHFNFPTELVVIDREDIESVKIFDSRKREILRFNQKVGDVDFAISFDDGYGVRTGFIRFKNSKSAERFSNYLNILVLR